MKIRWADFEFEISSEIELKLVINFVKEIKRMEKSELCKQRENKIKVSCKSKRNSPEYQASLAYKILLKRAIPKLEEDKWYLGKDIIELAGFPRSTGYLYYGLTKLVEDGILEEKRNGRCRLFKLKAKNESEEDGEDEDKHFNLKKMFLEEKKVMEGILK